MGARLRGQHTALICSVSGQDGSYLTQLLLRKGYAVFGASRDAQASSLSNLQKLGGQEQIHWLSMLPEVFSSILMAIQKSNPDEIYYLTGSGECFGDTHGELANEFAV